MQTQPKPTFVRTALLSAFALVSSLAAPAALGQDNSTQLKVDVGFGELTRSGRWTPIFVTVSDAKPRKGNLALYTPSGGSFGMRLRQQITVTPQPTTYQFYLPLSSYGYQLEEFSVVLTDAETDKTLARHPPDPTAAAQAVVAYPQTSSRDALFIGVSGEGAALRWMQGDGRVEGTSIAVGFLEPARLPYVPAGYDCLDLLVLNGPDFANMDGEQQQAIADWVRAGGNLLVWPGGAPVPPPSFGGPLMQILPAQIGSADQVEIPPAALSAAGQPERYAKMRGRQLDPVGGAEAVDLFAPFMSGAATGPTAYRNRVGLGRVIVSPVDLSEFQFDDPGAARKFWQPLLKGIATFAQPKPTDPSNPNYYNYNTNFGLPAQDLREQQAVVAASNFLADVPGAGRFGFSYVAVVMVGLMVIVGPIDWFVLRQLRRQPWTWVTTGGWIALITLGAVFIGHVFKSGELHYRTIRVVDQVDGRAVAADDFVCVYSPKTTSYELSYNPASWWEPVSLDVGYSRGGLRNDLTFRQSRYGTGPGPFRINVWNLRLLQAETIGSGDPLIEADLTAHLGPDGKLVRLVGTVKNLTPYAMKNVQVQLPFEQPVQVPTAAPEVDMEGADDAAEEVDMDAGDDAPDEAVETVDETAEESDTEAEPSPAVPATPALPYGMQPQQPQPQPMRPGVFVTAPALANVPAGGEVSFDLAVDDSKSPAQKLGAFAPAGYNQYYGYYGDDGRALTESDLRINAGELASRRSLAIEALLEQKADVACVYAEFVDPQPAVQLQQASEKAAVQKHYQVVRAVVPLTKVQDE